MDKLVALMSISPNAPDDRPERNFIEVVIIIWVLLMAVSFNLVRLYPEVAIKVIDINDGGMHLQATRLAVEAITGRQHFTDPWLSSIGLGYPLFHYYQHLPYVSVALVHVVTLQIFPIADMVNWTAYLLLSLFPLAIFWSMRLFGLDRMSSAMGGLVASLPSAGSLFGLNFGSYVWQGFGLYTQLWAMLLLPLSLGLGYRVLLLGRGFFWATLLLAATLLSHVVYGYMAFLTLGVLTLLQPLQQSKSEAFTVVMGRQWKRLIILFVMVVVVTSYFLVPLFLDIPYLNQSVREASTKYDSLGHVWVLQSLVSGDLFDLDRKPIFTSLIAVGFVICLLRWRKDRYLAPIAIFSFWLLLYFGRPTWGIFMDLLPMSRDIPMHRFIGGVHLGGIYLAGIALAVPWRWAISRQGVWYFLVAVVVTMLILLPLYRERGSYLAVNASQMSDSQRALAGEDRDLNALFENLRQLPPGRVYAGNPENWGKWYKVRRIALYVLLHGEGFDMVGVPLHKLSLNSDVSMIFDQTSLEQYNLYNVRYVVAPEGREFPAFVRPLQRFGRHRLYQVDTTGYFDLVGSDLAFSGDRTDFFPAASSWLKSGLPGIKQHPTVLIGGSSQNKVNPVPLSVAAEVIRQAEVFPSPFRGTVSSEEVDSNLFSADVTVVRDSLLLLKSTYHPNWRATVDGVKTDTVMLMPSFVGVQLSPGDHQVRIEYRPRRLRVILLGLGLLALPLIAVSEMRGHALSNRLFLRVMGPIASLVGRRRR